MTFFNDLLTFLRNSSDKRLVEELTSICVKISSLLSTTDWCCPIHKQEFKDKLKICTSIANSEGFNGSAVPGMITRFKEMIDDSELTNNSCPGASIEDVISLRDKFLAIKELCVCSDPECTTKRFQDNSKLAIEQAYEFTSRFPSKPTLSKCANLIDEILYVAQALSESKVVVESVIEETIKPKYLN